MLNRVNYGYLRIRFIYLFGNHRWFWKLRHKASYFKFSLKKRYIFIKQKFESFKKSKLSFRVIALTLLFEFILLLVFSYIYSESISDLFSMQLGGEQFWTALASMVGVHGVLIGLHFALLSALVTQNYSKASLSVIGYITKEEGNLNYALLNICGITVDLFLFVFIAATNKFLFGLLLYATFVCLICIMWLLSLASKSFFITDPSRLAIDPLNRLLFWARSATVNGHLFEDNNFQNFYRERADETMDTISELAYLAAEKSQATQKYLLEFSDYLFKCLRFYKNVKRGIPPKSYWFSRKIEHRSWDLADDSRLQIAAQTMTSLDAKKEEPNHFWLEERLMGQLQKLFAASLKSPENSVVVGIIDRINIALEGMGNDLEVEEAFAFTRNIRQLIQKSLDHSQEVKENVWIKAVIVERAALFASSISIGFFKFVDAFNLEEVERQIAALDWRNTKDLQSLGLPVAITKKVEDIAEKLAFETEIEGKRISPSWYCRDLIFRAMSETFHNELLEQIEFASKDHLALATELLKKEDFVSAAITCIDGLQHCHKILGNLPDIKEKATNMVARAVLKDLLWPDWKWDEYQKMLENAEKKLQILLSRCIEGLAQLPSDSTLPDLLGEATFKSGHACFDALRRNDATTFNAIFRQYLSGCIYCSRRHKKEVAITDDQFLLRKSVVILDALHLSGYAILYSELFQNEKLWADCKKVWDEMLLAEQNRKFFRAVITYYIGTFGIKPRDILRTTWQMTVQNDLNEKVEHAESWSRDGGIGFSQHIEASHPSLLIRTLASGTPIYGNSIHLHFTGLDIFIDLYLLNSLHFTSADFGRRAGDLRAEIRNRLSIEMDIDIDDIRRDIDESLPGIIDVD